MRELEVFSLSISAYNRGMRLPLTSPRHHLSQNHRLRPSAHHLSPASARTILLFSLLLDPVILSQPLHPYLHEWSTTALVLLFAITVKAGHPPHRVSLARSFVRKRLAILSSPRAIGLFLGLIGVTIIAEAALVFGRAAAPLLVVGAALGIPGALAIVRAFRSQFDSIRQRLEDGPNFEAAVQRAATTFTIGALLCARLCGFATAVSLIPLAGPPLASLLGIICGLSLLLSTGND